MKTRKNKIFESTLILRDEYGGEGYVGNLRRHTNLARVAAGTPYGHVIRILERPYVVDRLNGSVQHEPVRKVHTPD